ncbi:MAG: FGGY-family carbohydrate kinase, partial [Pseudomonadota bacterium]
ATTRAHLARATFEAIACQIADVFDAMEADMGQKLNALRADGGASANGFLMQLQADILGRRVLQSQVEEVGALGSAAMAFRSLGLDMVLETTPPTVFAPQVLMGNLRALWGEAVACAGR